MINEGDKKLNHLIPTVRKIKNLHRIPARPAGGENIDTRYARKAVTSQGELIRISFKLGVLCGY
jgi:hypothetical protein